MSIPFHSTGYGRIFFDSQLPALVKQLGRIADALEKANELKEQEAEVEVLITELEAPDQEPFEDEPF